mmetsp:Transcript_65361/g.120454  ORF Transcript_65361/g.120454 Transcript_65361/m.120454 type:complete len:413 (+) Transcript_65361:91-1329(+)
MAASALFHGFCLLSICLAAFPADAASGNDIVIEFEPMGAMNMGSMFDSLNALNNIEEASPTSNYRSNMRGPAKHAREAELDDVLSNVLSTVLMPPTVDFDPRSQSQMRSPSTSDSGAVPGALLMDLFPGPLGPMVVQESHAQPFLAPDPFIMDMVKALDSAFANDIMSPVHKAVSQERTPNSCEDDIRTKCQGVKSHLHCLGYNHEIISEDCRKDVGHSVPFLCSQDIDRWCNLLETGILSCLQGHMDGLDGKCRDAVLTTQHVINKANTHKASLVDPATGGTKVSRPEVKSGAAAMDSAVPAKDREATLDAKLGITLPPEQKAEEAITMQNASARPVASATDAGGRSSTFIFMREMNVAVLFLTIVGIVAYMIASRGNDLWSEVRHKFVLQKGPEFIKLVNHLELPKSTDL